MRSGQSARLYEPALQWKIQQQFASKVKIRLGPLPYIRPPFEALLFLPFAYLGYPAACLLWMAAKIVLLLAVPIFCFRWQGEALSFLLTLCKVWCAWLFSGGIRSDSGTGFDFAFADSDRGVKNAVARVGFGMRRGSGVGAV